MNELQPWATFVTIAHGRKIQGGAVNSLVVESLCNLCTYVYVLLCALALKVELRKW